MTVKGHNVVFILVAIAIITAAVIAMTYFMGIGNPQENRGATAVPDQEAASGNYSYFTANQTASQENTENNESVQISSTVNPTIEDHSANGGTQNTYVVKTYNGIIGVFIDDSDKPIQTVDVIVSSLPAGDQQSLEKGISVKGTNALRRLLEDYES